jgi:hypothetical protein
MTKTEISIQNKLIAEKRDITVYHHDTSSAHILSYDSSIILPLGTIRDNDYLHISVISGPGQLRSESVLNLPSWLDFEITVDRKLTVKHTGERTFLKIPPGPPVWQLKLSLPDSAAKANSRDIISIGDSESTR